jgi:hypothetical protein
MTVAESAVHQTAQSRRRFDADGLAHLEVAGWRAYYDHKWFLFLRLMLTLIHNQLRLSWPRTVQAAYYFTRASAAWSPIDHDEAVVKRFIRKFYRLGRRYGKDIRFDPDKVAALEFKYWDDHRRLSGRPQEEKGPLIRTLAELHSATFLLPLDVVSDSAVSRAHSTDTVDEITGKRSSDIEGDWKRSEDYLRDAYRSIARQLNT